MNRQLLMAAQLTLLQIKLELIWVMVRRLERERAMGIEIKGLREAVTRARQGIAEVRVASAGLNEDTGALLATIGDVRKAVQAAKSDLEFEAQTLGNSAGAGLTDGPAAPPAPAPAVKPGPLAGFETPNSMLAAGKA